MAIKSGEFDSFFKESAHRAKYGESPFWNEPCVAINVAIPLAMLAWQSAREGVPPQHIEAVVLCRGREIWCQHLATAATQSNTANDDVFLGSVARLKSAASITDLALVVNELGERAGLPTQWKIPVSNVRTMLLVAYELRAKDITEHDFPDVFMDEWNDLGDLIANKAPHLVRRFA
jgi:hypothetical protein